MVEGLAYLYILIPMAIMNSAIYTCDSIVPQRNHFVYQPPHIHVHVFGLTGPWDLKSMVSSVISIPVLNLHSIESDTKANNIMFCGRYLSLGGRFIKTSQIGVIE